MVSDKSVSKSTSNAPSKVSAKSKASRTSKFAAIKPPDEVPEPLEPVIELNEGLIFRFTSVGNLVMKEYPFEITIAVLQDGQVIDSSEPVKIENKNKHTIDVQLYYRVLKLYDEQIIDRLVSTPFVVAIGLSPAQKPTADKDAGRVETNETEEKKPKSKKDKKTRDLNRKSFQPSVKEGEEKTFNPSLILGQAPLDILPLLLGSVSRFEEDIILDTEVAKMEFAPFSCSIQLTVSFETMVDPEAKLTPPVVNVLTFTVRGMYNADLPEVNEKCYCVAGTPIVEHYDEAKEMEEEMMEDVEAAYKESSEKNRRETVEKSHKESDDSWTDSMRLDDHDDQRRSRASYSEDEEHLQSMKKGTTQSENLKVLVFEPGMLYLGPDANGVKRWANCKLANGMPALSRERLFDDYFMVKDKLRVNLERLEFSDGKRIYWNMFHRVALTPERQTNMFKTIIKHRKWPLEIIIASDKITPHKVEPKDEVKEAEKPASVKTKSGGKGRASTGDSKGVSAATNKKLNASSAPTKGQKGKTTGDAKIKQYIAFVDLSNLLYPGVTTTTVTAQLAEFNQDYVNKVWSLQEPLLKDYLQPKPEKSATAEEKPLTKSPNKPMKTLGKSKSGENINIKPPNFTMVYAPKRKPVFIVVDVKLVKAFVKKMETEEVYESVKQLLPKRKPFDSTDVGFIKASRDNFIVSIKNLSNVISKEYSDFMMLDGNDKHCYNDDKNFYEHLKNSGAERLIKESLLVPVTRYVTDIIGTPAIRESSICIQEYLTKLYTRLSEEIHKIVNENDILGRNKKNSPEPILPSDHLLFMAAEADAEHNFEKCKYYMLKRLENNTRDPEMWIDYAVPLISYKRFKQAVEVVQEALLLDPRNREGLLMLGALMTVTGKYQEAEFCFDALTRLYPTFSEGWMIFHIFYCKTGREEGADITMVTAIKCEAYSDEHKQHSARFPILNWDCYYYYEKDDLLLRTVIYLLSLNLYEFVEICIGEMLSLIGKKTLVYHYYLAACHFQQRRYHDSLRHLKCLSGSSWKDASLWCLRGHNYYYLNCHANAKKCYKMAIEITLKPKSLKMHIVHLRMGYYMLRDEKYDEALTILKTAVYNYPSACGWSGLGVTSYMLNNYRDAELALTESNILDPHLPISWAYLALINGLRKDVISFEQCARQAYKKGLSNKKLLKELWTVWLTLSSKGFSKFGNVQIFKSRLKTHDESFPEKPVRDSQMETKHENDGLLYQSRDRTREMGHDMAVGTSGEDVNLTSVRDNIKVVRFKSNSLKY